ncbi:trithorax group protein osa isoform X3 [Chrysoperla carnea]|uniref:trithorax group protein osa isoform X3 n=1 Tax=Chrysoperla carnea TaxID=189513 RepID=UPI001D065DD9|nr:trithorax group protein osa isoform X3 [Chrysoperla carnea]
MATAVSEQNNVQQTSGDAKITPSQVMHNGTDLKQGSNVKIESNTGSTQRLFGMSHHQYIPTSSSEVTTTPGQLPSDPGSGVHTSSPKQSPGNENSGPNKQSSSPSSNTEFMHGNDESGGPRPNNPPGGYPPMNASKMQLPLNVRPGGPGPGMVMYTSPQGPSQQYLSGHRISQQSGPTPTLNHLLQTSNTMQRMQNCYGPPQGPPTSNVGSGGNSGPNDSMPYSPQSWQHPQGPPQQSQNTLYPPHQGNMPPIPPSPNASMPPTSTPQIYGNPSSPFVHRPPQSSTPNTNLPDSVDLAGQNSNDSFTGGVNSAGGTNAGGGGAPGTPNSQGMRPSPSPTGSTGSRSMSPAVGQQNIQMPPRPSSSQSDGSGPTRMSHSPMATQGGYQGPPQSSHITGYKMPGGVGGQSTGSSGPPGGPPYSGGGPQHTSGPPQSHNQFPPSTQGNYGAARAPGNMQYSPNQVYGGPNNPGGQGPNPNVNNINSAQYSGRPMPNHFPGYQSQPWNPPGSGGAPPLSPNMAGKGGNIPVSQQSGPPGQGGPPASSPLLHAPNSQSPRPPPHYLKQHLTHKFGGGGGGSISVVTSHSPPQGYPGMGPPNVGMHHHVGATMGPPSMGGHMGHNISMGPPNIGQSNSHDGGPMPPPSSTPNSHMPISIGGDVGPSGSGSETSSVDNGITTTAASNVGTHVTPSVGGNTVTSVVTTGPDGTSLDEGSQQSTLSNASIASGEDPQCSTPKSRKNDLSSSGGHYSHPTTPQSTVPSPGAASMNSMHADEYDISSPSWPRTPASPKSDSLSKLYEMDDSPDRRAWLDKLLAFMEERRTPITTCPTISKNPLDLFRLYLYVKDRGGFMEVCKISPSSNNIRPTVPYSKVTKNKTWKDIAGMLGIGASSSAAYTLRKHYTKNLLAFECKFDRGGIDPQPIINQVEATSKKKGAKSASIPSPGSSNSQDSFPTPGSSGASMDGYGGYGYPPGSQPDYNSPQMQQRPSSQTNAPSPHPNANVMNHQGNNQTGDNISVSNPFDDGASGGQGPPRYGSGAPPGSHQFGPGPGAGGSPRPQGGMPGQGYTGQTGYNQYQGTGTSPDPYQNYPNNSNYPQTTRALSNYPPYSPDTESRGGYPPASSISSTSMASSNSNPAVTGSVPAPDPYNRYNMNTTGPGGTFTPRQGYGINTNPSTSQPSAQSQSTGYTGQPEYARNDYTNYPGGTPGQTSPVSGSNQVFGNGKAMPPPTTQPRRHPDFAKDQQPQYPPYNPQKPQMYGWPNNQYRGTYSGQPQGIPTGQTGQWPQANVPPRGGPPPPGGPAGANVPPATNSATWGPEHRYPPGAPGAAGATGTYPAPQPGQPQWNQIPPNPVGQNTGMRPTMVARPPYRAEGKPPFSMPPPQVLNKSSPTSGGMTTSSYTQQPLPKREITFPPDSVEAATAMFYRRKRLTRMDVAPLDAWRIMMSLRSGLLCETTWALDVLNILLFDDTAVAYFGLAHLPGLLDTLLEHFQRSLTDMFELAELTDSDKPWYELPKKKYEEVDLGAVTTPIDSNDHVVFLANTPNYSMTTRKNAPVKIVPKDDEIFILDNHRSWDSEPDPNERCVMAQITFEPWQLTSSGVEMNPTDHILTCFQAEFGNVPFARLLKPSKKQKLEENVKIEEDKDDNTTVDIKEEPQSDNEDNTDKRKKVSEVIEKDSVVTKSDKESDETLNKKRTKTLNSDVIESNDDSTPNLTTTATTTTTTTQQQQGEKEKVKTEQQITKVPVDIEDDGLTRGATNECSMDPSDVKIKTPSLPCKQTKLITTLGSIKYKVNIQDEAGVLKRRRMSDYEDEPFSRDEPSLCLITETQESLGRRCICISTILRNLTFIPGNELEFARNSTFLGLLGKLLILHHEHPVRTQKTRNYDREEDADFADSCSSLQGETYWWWDYLMQVRENVLVATANISGHIDLEPYPEEIARPILDGLLHWAVCPSAHGQDPFLSVGPFSMLSPQRLALESLCKLCVTDANVDLVIATPPFSRLERLCSVLTKLLCRSEEQVLREFAVNLLHYLSAASSAMARVIALQSPCVSLLVSFIEQAEQSALGIANQHGIGALRENPDAMGTSLDMLRRAAHTLLHLARHPDNRPLFIQQEQRLLSLAMSQILDQQVANIISSVLYECSAPFSSRRRSMVHIHHDTASSCS